MPVLMFGCETMIWKEKEKSRIRGSLLGIRNAWIRELCGMAIGVDERIEEDVLH